MAIESVFLRRPLICRKSLMGWVGIPRYKEGRSHQIRIVRPSLFGGFRWSDWVDVGPLNYFIFSFFVDCPPNQY